MQDDRDPYRAEAMAGGEDFSWNDFPLHTDGLGGVDDWHDRSVTSPLLIPFLLTSHQAKHLPPARLAAKMGRSVWSKSQRQIK